MNLFICLRRRADVPGSRALQALCAAMLFVALLPLSPLLAAQEPTTPDTAAAALPSPSASVVTADAVQEAFVRVAERVRASVVKIETSRNAASPKDAPKSPPKAPPKNAPKSPPKAEPEPTPDDAPEEDDPGANPFGLPLGPRDPRDRPRASGTGMVISNDGFVLTNYHVVRGGAFIRVLFDSDAEVPTPVPALLVGYDEDSDLAVLKLLRPREGLRPVEFADSDAVRVGEWALAVGAPFEQAQSVTVGVVSAKARHLEGKDGTASLQDYIQTDASINPGNSGGPLFNLDGKVIGINTAILSPSRYNVGIGFSVPSKTISALLPTLLKGQPIERGFMGISYMRLNPGVAQEFGLEGGMHIGALPLDEKTGKPIGPAKDAGLQVDDIITHLDGKPVGSVEEFRRQVAGQRPGTTIRLRVARPTEGAVDTKEIALKLGSRPGKKLVFPTLRAEPTASSLGLEVQDMAKLSPDERDLFRLDPARKGVIITDVLPGSLADEAQVRRGMRVMRARVNGGAWQNIATKAAFEKVEASLAPGARLLIQLRDRDDVSVYNLIVAPPRTSAAAPASA